MNDDQNDIVEGLIVRSLTGESSAEDEKELSAWIASSKQNEAHYLALKKALGITQSYYSQKTDHLGEINVDREWMFFLDQVKKKQEKNSSKPLVTPVRNLVPEKAPSRLWMRIAAAILLLVTSGVLINYFIFDTSVHFQTGENTLSVSLADGSTVLLNRNTELTYSTHLGSKLRTVTLKGEAFFEVARDPNKPFVIHAGNAEVEVLGTSFNVANYESQKEVEVTVETGIVKLSAPGDAKEVKLHPGEKGIYVKANQQVAGAMNDNVNFLSWKTRKIVFVANDLRTAVETINKAYGTNITINADVPLSCVVTVTFDNQSLEAALNVLKATLNLTYRIEGNQIEITHAGC